jgi:hypothetical protein
MTINICSCVTSIFSSNNYHVQTAAAPAATSIKIGGSISPGQFPLAQAGESPVVIGQILEKTWSGETGRG